MYELLYMTGGLEMDLSVKQIHTGFTTGFSLLEVKFDFLIPCLHQLCGPLGHLSSQCWIPQLTVDRRIVQLSLFLISHRTIKVYGTANAQLNLDTISLWFVGLTFWPLLPLRMKTL
jgi:hypothetical protein